jgi:superfamily II DNA or RNA helicase
MMGNAAGETATNDFELPVPGSVLAGPFWPGEVRVVAASRGDFGVRLQTVGVQSNVYDDRTLTADQYLTQVRPVVGGLFRFDAEPRLFRLAVEALRTHLAHAFDPQFAVSVSQVDPLPHQVDAVYRHMLPQQHIRFLLADDPGAGKTIMAGLLMRELIARGDVKRVLVLCPKALTDQWRREMWERFRERFVLLTGEAVSAAYGQNAWVENDRIVASVDLAVQDHIRPGLEQSNWDLVIFDEAHKLSAYRYGLRGKIDKTQRYQLAEILGRRTRHLLLMTATPHRGDPENFRLLMTLLDDKVFASQDGLHAALNPDGSPYFLRRMKENMKGFDGRKLFLDRHVKTVQYPLDSHEQQVYDAVTEYVANGLQQAETAGNRNVGLAMTILQRRLASSLYAIHRSLERRRGRLDESLQKNRGAAVVREEPAAYTVFREDDDELTEDQEDQISTASLAKTAKELEAEIAWLDRLIDLTRTAMYSGPERKLREFRTVVDNELVSSRSEKILVFTEHRDTMEYLTARVREWGYNAVNIHGGMKLQDRIAAEKDFRGGAQFLIATDAAGEGINLQFCHLMMNWDLPWNPNRLEQRMGRIHRYGQEFEVQIYNLVAETTREGAVMIRLMDKLDRMRQALGRDQVYDVISDILGAGHAQLDILIRDAITNRRSIDQIEHDIDFIEQQAGIDAARQVLGEALATEFIDMAFINAERRDSKERRLTPEYVERFFVDALQYVEGRLTRGQDQTWRLDFIPAALRQAVRARVTGEVGAENRVITFHKERLRREPPAEFMAPGHPLFDAVTEALLEAGRPALARGAVFVDREARQPYLVWLLEATAVNGLGAAVHRRLLALRQREDGALRPGSGQVFEPVSPGLVLNLPPADSSPTAPHALVTGASGDRAISHATAYYADRYVAEVRADEERRAGIIEKALLQSVGDRLTELQARLERQFADRERGKDMDIAIRTTNHEIDALQRELSRRRDELLRRRELSLGTPRVVGVAAVVPGIMPGEWEKTPPPDRTAVERAAMKVAFDYERAHGRVPVDASGTGEGYDVKSAAADGSSVRYIEVKGHLAAGDITLYYTEWQMANRMRSEFFIYDVTDALGEPRLRIVQDPVGKGIEPEERVVEYRIAAADLARAQNEVIVVTE